MTYAELTDRMRAYNGQIAPGSECHAWQEYVGDPAHPIDVTDIEAALDTEPHDATAGYWLAVAEGDHPEWCADCGQYLEAGCKLGRLVVDHPAAAVEVLRGIQARGES